MAVVSALAETLAGRLNGIAGSMRRGRTPDNRCSSSQSTVPSQPGKTKLATIDAERHRKGEIT
jgi:hypothetical protein